jgi:dolichol-phosphate mannosyltransferase
MDFVIRFILQYSLCDSAGKHIQKEARMYSIVIPAYNEEEALYDVVTRTLASNPGAELILVDDGSSDGTWSIMKTLADEDRVRAFSHQTNRGKTQALKTGYQEARTETIVTIDADMSYPPESIPSLVFTFDQGYDMVVGSRFLNGIPKATSLIRSFANITGARIASAVLKRRVTDLTTGLRVFNKRVASLEMKASNLDYEAELTSRVISNGMRYAEVPIAIEQRVGKSKLKFFQNCYLFMKAVFVGKYSHKTGR